MRKWPFPPAGFCTEPHISSGDTAHIRALGGKHRAMQVTRAADYALRAMIQLAQLPHESRMPLTALALETGAPESFLSKVMQGLCQVGFATSRRGQSGGFAIAAAGRDASVAAIIEAMDGPISLNVCLDPGSGCRRKANCPGHRAFAKAQVALLAVLQGETIGELAAPEPHAARSRTRTNALNLES